MTTPTAAPTVIDPKPEVQSAQPLGSLTPAQRKQRYEQLRKRMGKSKLEVQGDPKLHYFWAHRTDDAQIIEFESKEYQIVREPNAVDVLAGKAKPKIIASGLRVDGTYIVGDVILLSCPLEVYEFLMLDQDERMNDQKRAATEGFRSEAEKAGVPVFETVAPRKG